MMSTNAGCRVRAATFDTAASPRERTILHIDMDAFFASVEQLDHPEWRARPIAITNGDIGTCIITCSYEARAFGIRSAMRAAISAPIPSRISGRATSGVRKGVKPSASRWSSA